MSPTKILFPTAQDPHYKQLFLIRACESVEENLEDIIDFFHKVIGNSMYTVEQAQYIRGEIIPAITFHS